MDRNFIESGFAGHYSKQAIIFPLQLSLNHASTIQGNKDAERY